MQGRVFLSLFSITPRLAPIILQGEEPFAAAHGALRHQPIASCIPGNDDQGGIPECEAAMEI